MYATISPGRPELWQQLDTADGPLQEMGTSDRDHTGRLRQRSAPYEICRTPIVTRVLHQGEEVPKEKCLQWLVNEILYKNALRLGDEPFSDVVMPQITEEHSTPSSLTLHVECAESGKHLP